MTMRRSICDFLIWVGFVILFAAFVGAVSGVVNAWMWEYYVLPSLWH